MQVQCVLFHIDQTGSCVPYLSTMPALVTSHDALEAFKVVKHPHLGLRLKIGQVYTKEELQRRCQNVPNETNVLNALDRHMQDAKILQKVRIHPLSKRIDAQPGGDTNPQYSLQAAKIRKKLFVHRPGDLRYSDDDNSDDA